MATRKSKIPSRSNKPKGPKKSTPERQTKQHRLIEMLQRPQGATIAQMAEALGWQPHTVRGTLSGALKKRLGLDVTSVKADGLRKYRLAADGGKGA